MAHNRVGQMGFIKGVGSIYPARREEDVKRMSWKREVFKSGKKRVSGVEAG
ncbi:hypothetical protein K0038_04218 [Pseudomonas syringae]|nr:hypothetical protein [Pseudomonas syringae]